MKEIINQKIGQNRKKLFKLLLIVLFSWLISVITLVIIIDQFKTMDEFLLQKHIIEDWPLYYFLPFLLLGLIWQIGSLLLFIVGSYNLYLIRKNNLKFSVWDFVTVIVPVTFYLIRYFVRYPSFDPFSNLPVY